MDEELLEFEKEGREAERSRRVLLSGHLDHPLIEGLQVDALEAVDRDLHLDFSVRFAGGSDVVDAVVWVNPRGGTWRQVPMTLVDGAYEARVPTRQTHTGGVYWYLTVRTASGEALRVGSPTKPFTLDP